MIVRIKLPPYQRRKRGPTKTSKYQKMIAQTILNDLPSGTELLESQVAGHTFQIGTDEIGMIFSFLELSREFVLLGDS